MPTWNTRHFLCLVYAWLKVRETFFPRSKNICLLRSDASTIIVKETLRTRAEFPIKTFLFTLYNLLPQIVIVIFVEGADSLTGDVQGFISDYCNSFCRN